MHEPREEPAPRAWLRQSGSQPWSPVWASVCWPALTWLPSSSSQGKCHVSSSYRTSPNAYTAPGGEARRGKGGGGAAGPMEPRGGAIESAGALSRARANALGRRPGAHMEHRHCERAPSLARLQGAPLMTSGASQRGLSAPGACAAPPPRMDDRLKSPTCARARIVSSSTQHRPTWALGAAARPSAHVLRRRLA